MTKNIYDLVIIGGGMAGLSAAINAGAEGLKTLIISTPNTWGGQAKDSSLIENFLGFPQGISGPALVGNAIVQAMKFDVDMLNEQVFQINKHHKSGNFNIETYDGCYRAKSVLIATGMSYKKLDTPGVDKFIGKGISYGAPQMNGSYCKRNVVIVGGANSAGQAAMFLAGCEGCKVHLVIRNEKKTGTMSYYLSERVLQQENIVIYNESKVHSVHGDTKLMSASIGSDNEAELVQCDEMYIMVGGNPQTAFLHESALLDKDCFVKSGYNDSIYGTSVNGMFVAGDVRSGAVRRISTAVGEGASVINDIRTYLLKQNNND